MAIAIAHIWGPLLGVAAVQWFTAEIYKPHTKPIVYIFLLSGRQLHRSLVDISKCERQSIVRQFSMTDFFFKMMQNGKLAHRNLFQLFNIILTLFLEM